MVKSEVTHGFSVGYRNKRLSLLPDHGNSLRRVEAGGFILREEIIGHAPAALIFYASFSDQSSAFIRINLFNLLG